MKIIEIIESKVWNHKISGLNVSPYGATPWVTESDRDNWELVTRGYTWRLANGTVGLGRVPAKTREEAEDVMAKYNARFA